MVNSHGNPVKSTTSKVVDPLKLKKPGEKKPRGESASENAGRRSSSPGMRDMRDKELGRYEFERVPRGHRTDRRRHGSDRDGGKGDGESVAAGGTGEREHAAEVSPEHHPEHSTKHVKRLRTSRGSRSEGGKKVRSKTEQEGDGQVSGEKAVFKEGSPKDEIMEDREPEKLNDSEPADEPTSDKYKENAADEVDDQPVTGSKTELTLVDKDSETRQPEVKADVELAHDVTNDTRARLSEETEIRTEKLKMVEQAPVNDEMREEAGKYVAGSLELQEAGERKVDHAEPDTSLSLGLSGSRQLHRTRSYQTISQAETFSHGITTSLSLSCSHQFTHNPSCSLTQTSHDNQEFSSASQPVHQEPSVSVGKRLQHGEYVHQRDMNHSRGENGHHFRPKGSMHRKQVKSSSFTRSGGSERWNERPMTLMATVREIVSEPAPLVARKMQDLPGEVLEELKTTVRDLLDRNDKRDECLHLQKILQSRNDLSADALQMAHRVQLGVLVALKTGLPSFLLQENQKILIEVFMHSRCPNIQCLNQLPVDNCECKICTQKNGFCNACMCVVCSKFDLESNTCSWVGCDYCIHWCHTDCGLRKSYIKSGPTIKGVPGTSEMQFHCTACGHKSELFGFVKDVFVSCARAWSKSVLCKELDCAKRMFHGSEDVRGKQLCRKADQLLRKLDSDSDVTEACNIMLRFFEDSANLPLEEENSTGLGDPSTALERAALALQNYDRLLEEKRTDAAEMQYERAKKKAEIEELESIVRIKQAEAKMFQARADEAAREAEGLQRIVMAKRLKDDEDYTAKISKLQLVEAEEKRKRKFEYLKVLERGSYNFDIVRTLMGDLQGLLTNMESAKRLKADDVAGVEKYLQRYLQSRAI